MEHSQWNTVPKGNFRNYFKHPIDDLWDIHTEKWNLKKIIIIFFAYYHCKKNSDLPLPLYVFSICTKDSIRRLGMFIEMSLSFKLYALREKFPYSEYFWSECGEIWANGHFLRGYIYM